MSRIINHSGGLRDIIRTLSSVEKLFSGRFLESPVNHIRPIGSVGSPKPVVGIGFFDVRYNNPSR